MKACRFLLEIWSAQGSGYFCISTKSRDGAWRDNFFKAPLKLNEIREFIDSHSNRNLYFCPTPLSKPRRVKENVVGSAFLWADLDEARPQSQDPKPQVAWASSPGRYACLWRLNEFHDAGPIERINKAMTYKANADHGGWDLTQVLRIPGTKNYKYPSSPVGKLLWMTDNKYPIGDFPDEVPSADGHSLIRRWKRRLKGATYRLLTAKQATQGKRSEVIYRLERELYEHGVPKLDIISMIKASVWNKFAGRRDEEAQLTRELDKIEDVAIREVKEIKHDEPVIVRMSDVEAEEISWLWYPYIPKGKVTLMEGDPGLGKSWVTMAIGSYLSQRKKLPGANKFVGGRVLIMSAEDGIGDTIRPRLDSLEADVHKIFAYTQPTSFDEEGCEELEGHIERLSPILVIVDPLVAYLGGTVDLHKANETREVMARLSRVAEKHGVAIVAVRHLTKGGRDKSIYRGIGSIDLTAAARSVIMIGQDPNEDHARVLVHIKCNLAPLGMSVRYELRPGMKRPFRWAGLSDLSAKDVMEAPESVGGNNEYAMAKDYLRAQLESGPQGSDVIKREAEARGISLKVLSRVAHEMGVKRSDSKWRLD